MDIALKKPLGANSPADEDDVRAVKKALNHLGYYTPFEKTGVTGIPDAALFEAVKEFQKDQGFLPTGAIRPEDETFAALRQEIKKPKKGFYIWHTVGDSRVRESHAEMEGTLRNWEESPVPGEEPKCRCWAVPVDDEEMEALFPDAIKPTISPFDFIGGSGYAVKQAVRIAPRFAVNRFRDASWTLGKYKSSTKWENQLRKRNWTEKQITQTVKNGKKYKAPNKVNPDNTATRYEYNGRFVVRDDQTKEILQISGDDFIPN